MITPIEQQTMKKVYLRLLPFCFILYFICYLDRVNIGFAALTMNKDLGLSSYVFGLGAGAFFWGYFILEVPSNLILDRVGARRWIARIMVTWGLVGDRIETQASALSCRHRHGPLLLRPRRASGNSDRTRYRGHSRGCSSDDWEHQR